MRNKVSIKRVCCVGSIYSLMVYLMSCTDEELDTTYFVFSYHISKDVAKVFPQKVRMPYIFYFHRFPILYSLITKFLFSFVKRRLPSNPDIYAHDHLLISPLVIGDNKYTCIEDSAYVFSNYYGSKSFFADINNLYNKNYAKLKYILGPNYGNKFAYGSELCKALLVTKIDKAKYISHLPQNVVNIDAPSWNRCSNHKKHIILETFSITSEDISILSNADVVFLTQPIVHDLKMPLSDYNKVVSDILKRYKNKKVVFKTHPRDTYDYNKYFRNIVVFKKQVPFQVLTMIGVRFNHIATICTTAFSQIDYPVTIDWFGTEIHERILSGWGHCDPPIDLKNKVNIINYCDDNN